MIWNVVINAVFGVITTILGVLPNAPATPPEVSAAGAWITTQVTNVIGILNMLYGTALLSAIMLVIIAMFNWEWIYHSTMWLVRKIPVVNIK